MHFEDRSLSAVLTTWREARQPSVRSIADNLWFEERLSVRRQRIFEDAVAGSLTPEDVRRRHVDYWNDFVRVDENVPHTFAKAVDPADLGDLHPTQKILRIESLLRPLRNVGLTFERFAKAFERRETALIDVVLRAWNASAVRDWRPAFAVFEDELKEAVADPEWPNKLRDRLGLAHYDCAGGPIPVALMRYSVSEVTQTVARHSAACSFTAPTVLDSAPWPFFFPAPVELSCGRSMPLTSVADEHELVAEILHFRIEYRRDHLFRIGSIDKRVEPIDLRALRNDHLLAVRLLSARYDFAEEIT